jgi:hypothetical protein
MKHDQRPTIDDVARLVKGRSSPNRVGSRGVSHRLRLHERTKLEVAKTRGFLAVVPSTRDALLNAWFMWCQATDTPFRIEARDREAG